MDPSKWLDWIKLPTKTLAGLCVVYGILIFSSDVVLEKFGLKSLVTEYRAYIGIGFLVVIALTIVNSVSAMLKFFYPWIAEAYWIRIGKNVYKVSIQQKNEYLNTTSTIRYVAKIFRCKMEQLVLLKMKG